MFNLNTKYTPNNYDNAIWMQSNGFCFGNNILLLAGNKLNGYNEGWCHVGADRHYNIEAVDGKSPLTGENEKFTAAELEVY